MKTDESSSTADYVDVPTLGAIICLRPAVFYIQNSSLHALQDVMGFEDLMEMACLFSFTEDGDPEEELYNILSDKEFDKLKDIANLDEVHFELNLFQKFITMKVLQGLREDTQEKLEEYGYRITKWLSSTSVLIESHDTVKRWYRSRVARCNDKTAPAVGSDRRLARDNRSVRDREYLERSLRSL